MKEATSISTLLQHLSWPHHHLVGCTNWRLNVVDQPTPQNAERIILDLRTQLGWMEGVTGELKKRSAALVEKSKSFCGEVESMKSTLGKHAEPGALTNSTSHLFTRTPSEHHKWLM